MSVEYGISADVKIVGSWNILFMVLAFVTFIMGFFIYRIIVERKTCTVPVEAVCVDYCSSHSNKDTTYSPVWEYEFEGRIIRSSEKIYSDSLKVKQGETRVLYVNPDNPVEFRQNMKGYLFFICVSAIIAVLIIWAMTVKAGN